MMPTIQEAAALLRKGEQTAVSLLEQCLERIERYEPRVRAWVFVDRDRAIAEAKAVDAERARGVDRGPLHGIPVGIKDIIDVFDWPTACGSRLWAKAYARHDAPVVERLRHAGAVLIGKTHTTQYASFDPSPTRNPWDLARTPGGSSSGSAAAVASGMCLAALATQTGGSITRPAAFCGVAGLKPTYGLADLHGVLPLAASMDHMGAMARTVHDVGLVMRAIADPWNTAWLAQPDDTSPPLLIGRLRGFFERYASDAVNAMMDRTGAALTAAGVTVCEIALPAELEEVTRYHRVVMAVEAAAYHGERLRRHPDDYDPNIRGLIEEGLACSAPVYVRAKDYQLRLQTVMRGTFRHVRTLLCPATIGPAPDAATTGDPIFNSPWSLIGFPVASFPVGLEGGLPLCVQVVAPPHLDGVALADAARCEAALGVSLGEPLALA